MLRLCMASFRNCPLNFVFFFWKKIELQSVILCFSSVKKRDIKCIILHKPPLLSRKTRRQKCPTLSSIVEICKSKCKENHYSLTHTWSICDACMLYVVFYMLVSSNIFFCYIMCVCVRVCHALASPRSWIWVCKFVHKENRLHGFSYMCEYANNLFLIDMCIHTRVYLCIL